MIPIQHDISLVIGSTLFAFVAGYFLMPIQKIWWRESRRKFATLMLFATAALLGLLIWSIHFIGMTAIHLSHVYHFDFSWMLLSYLSVFTASIFTLWLMIQSIWSFSRVALAIVVMSLGVSAMHYTSSLRANFERTEITPITESSHATYDLLFAVVLISALLLIAMIRLVLSELRLASRNRQLRWANKELENQNIQDNLTKLPNRLYLAEYADILFSKQQHQQEIAFLYIDLDRFKAVNDVFGHQVGDQLLIQLTARIHQLWGDRSKLLRIGGDEFLMVLENTSVSKASEMSEQILNLIQDSFLIDGKTINISGSIGIAMYPEHGKNLQDLLVNADAAMLSSKYQGRNTYSVFNFSSDQHESKSQSKLINDLYKAVEDQQFVLFYQPKFTSERKICGVEALIRWQHPLHGLLGPNMFIHGAEKTGLIIQMGYWALEQACKQIQLWEKNNTDFFPIAVNLSAVQFEHKHLLANLQNLFKRYKINPQHLMIEITESTAMHYIDASIRTLEQLRNIGIQLAIDDFGTGHSSFLYLKNLPVDELKIDKEFIQDLSVGSKEEMILESIIRLAIKLGLKVTAEGVETTLQADILTRLGCQQLQGYLLAKPMPVESLEIQGFLS